MDRQRVIERVHTRTYYIAEHRKRERPDLCDLQTSHDNCDILSDYINAEMNRIKAYLGSHAPSVSWNDETPVVDPSHKDAEVLSDRLDKAIEDYLVEHIVYRWLMDNEPSMADISFSETFYDRLKTCVSALGTKVRRRATTMGI